MCYNNCKINYISKIYYNQEKIREVLKKMDKSNIGIENTVLSKVNETNTALSMGSGGLEVFATPAVSALMEKAAFELIQPYLDEGITTVGTMISLEHISASPIGADITAKAVLTDIDGRKFCFDIFAYDNVGLIAQGKHERFSVKTESFMKKADTKIRKE